VLCLIREAFLMSHYSRLLSLLVLHVCIGPAMQGE
jgi:hypothetical protein